MVGVDIHDHIERRIITGLVISGDYIKLVQEKWQDRLIGSPEYVMIAHWCFDHFTRYGRHPGREIHPIFLDRSEHLPKAERELIEACLTHISNRYNYEADEDFDPQHLYDQTVSHFRKRAIEEGIESASIDLDDGRVDAALVKLAESLKPTIETTDEGGVREAAVEAIVSALDGDLSRARVAGWKIATAGAPPDMLPDPWSDPEPPPFDLRLWPTTLQRYASAQAQVIGCQTSAVAWAALSVCGAALDGSLRLQLKHNDPTFTAPPCFWMSLIGNPSSRKSPVIKAVTSPLSKVQLQLIQQAREEWEREDEATRGPEPHPVQIITHAANVEGFRDILVHQDRGVLLCNDELSQVIGSMGRYSGGRDPAAADRAAYNKAFDGGLQIWNRANRKQIIVKNFVFGMIAGIQPDVLRGFNRDNALMIDGMLQRICPILMGSPRIGSDIDISGPLERYKKLIERLAEVPGNYTLILTPEAEVIRKRVEERVFQYEQIETLGMGFATATGKLHGLWGRFALILAHVLSPYPPAEVDDRAAGMAEHLVFDSLIPNMARFYQMMGAGSDVEVTRSIASFLLREKRARITPTDIVQHVRGIPDRKTDRVREAVSPLVAMGWLTPEGEDERRARAWLINPAIYDQFAERAELERMRTAMSREALSSMLEQSSPRARAHARKQECQYSGEKPDQILTKLLARAADRLKSPDVYKDARMPHGAASARASSSVNIGLETSEDRPSPDLDSQEGPPPKRTNPAQVLRAQGEISHNENEQPTPGRNWTLGEKIAFNSRQSRLNRKDE